MLVPCGVMAYWHHEYDKYTIKNAILINLCVYWKYKFAFTLTNGLANKCITNQLIS